MSYHKEEQFPNVLIINKIICSRAVFLTEYLHITDRYAFSEYGL